MSFFKCKLKNIHEVLLPESILTQKKILVKNNLGSHKIFAKCVTFWELAE